MTGVGVGVLGLDVLDDFRIRLILHPVVVVDALLAEVDEGVGVNLSHWRRGKIGLLQNFLSFCLVRAARCSHEYEGCSEQPEIDVFGVHFM